MSNQPQPSVDKVTEPKVQTTVTTELKPKPNKAMSKKKAPSVKKAEEVEFTPGKYDPVIDIQLVGIPEATSSFTLDETIPIRLAKAVSQPLKFSAVNIIGLDKYNHDLVERTATQLCAALGAKKLFSTMNHRERTEYYEDFKVVNNTSFMTPEIFVAFMDTIGTFDFNGATFKPRNHALIAEHFLMLACLTDTEYSEFDGTQFFINTESANWRQNLRAYLCDKLEEISTGIDAVLINDIGTLKTKLPKPETWNRNYIRLLKTAGFVFNEADLIPLVNVLGDIDQNLLDFPDYEQPIDDLEEKLGLINIRVLALNSKMVSRRLSDLQSASSFDFYRITSRLFAISKDVRTMRDRGDHWQIMAVNELGESLSMFQVSAAQRKLAYVLQTKDPKVVVNPASFQGFGTETTPFMALLNLVRKTSIDQGVAASAL